MLKQFSFRNCYSFKNETVFSMEAVYAMKDNINFIRTIMDENEKACNYILPVAAIYGKNAGGKSNIMKILTDAATNICRRESRVKNMPFLGSIQPNEKFEHKFNFLINKYEYEYIYTANNNVIISESLKRRHVSSAKEKKYENIFDRNGTEVISGAVENSNSIIIKQSAQNPNTLIINNVGPFKIEPFEDIYKWFESILSVTEIKGEKEREDYLNEFADSLADKPEKIDRLSKFMNKFDPAIKGVRPVLRTTTGNDIKKRYRLTVWHNFDSSDTEDTIGYPVEWESNGTKKILELYPALIDALDNGKILIFDELDTMLHPLIFKKLVALFNSKIENPKNAQLIFTAHNTIIMNREDLRRDEIHIVDKDNYGCSEIFRLSDIEDEDGKKIRMDARYDWTYLEGLIGAVPTKFQDIKINLGGV